jgi:4-diphosphocytidyl-2-C-methyl-D-erythritol kinase
MAPRRASLRALAKINLDLRVLHKNPDGFHELRTVFQTVSLADIIDIEYEKARRTELTLDDPAAIADNLVLKSARAVLEALSIHARVRFRLTKRIPMGGGLGGGSSDAAAVLLALPVLVGRTLSPVRQQEIAASLGSDVPFFLTGGTALGLARGTEIYPLPDISAEPMLVISPGIHIATAPAYSALRRSLTFADSSRSINSFQTFVRALCESRSAGAASAFSANDFEAVVSSQFPQFQTLAGKLWKLGAKGVRMTGSGSAVFAVFGDRAGRERARGILTRDRMLQGGQVLPAAVVSRRNYQRLWHRQLSEHLVPNQKLWPPQSRYER